MPLRRRLPKRLFSRRRRSTAGELLLGNRKFSVDSKSISLSRELSRGSEDGTYESEGDNTDIPYEQIDRFGPLVGNAGPERWLIHNNPTFVLEGDRPSTPCSMSKSLDQRQLDGESTNVKSTGGFEPYMLEFGETSGLERSPDSEKNDKISSARRLFDKAMWSIRRTVRS
jgi:hypothetical protein